jgi:hypothetical protein
MNHRRLRLRLMLKLRLRLRMSTIITTCGLCVSAQNLRLRIFKLVSMFLKHISCFPSSLFCLFTQACALRSQSPGIFGIRRLLCTQFRYEFIGTLVMSVADYNSVLVQLKDRILHSHSYCENNITHMKQWLSLTA